MIRNDRRTGESTEMMGRSTDLSQDMVTKMTNAGMLAAGSLPSFDVEKEEAQKTIMEKLTGEPVITQKKRRQALHDRAGGASNLQAAGGGQEG